MFGFGGGGFPGFPMNNLLNMNFPPQHQLPFKQQYRAFPVVMANKPQLEAGDKIVLPPSALDQLARLRVTYPMMFKLTNRQLERSTHCGVMEFSAEEGVCYLPYWMMQNLLLESGGIVDVLNVTIPKGNFVKLQPHTTAFTQLNNPRVVLERALRSFSCLSMGDTIAIQHGEQQFYLDVVEVKPGRAISIIETDVNVDFAPPKDMPDTDARHPNSASPLPATHSTHSTIRKSSSSQLPATGSGSSSSSSSERKAGEEFVFHAGQDTSQEKFFEHDGGLHEGNALLSEKGEEKKAGSSSDYFAKLGGGGHRLNAKKSGSASSTPTSTPTPVTTAPATTPSNLSLSSPATATAASSNSALPPRPTTVVETVGQWDYVYSVDSKGGRKLMRRLPTKKKTVDELRGESGGGEVFNPFAGSGHSLK